MSIHRFGVLARRNATPAGNPDAGDYGAHPSYNTTSFYSSGSAFLVAAKIDLSEPRSGTIEELVASLYNIDTTARECVMSLYSHNAGSDIPDVSLSQTRFTNAGSNATWVTQTRSASVALAEQQVVWLIVAFENSSSRLSYTSGAGRSLLVTLDTGEWVNDTEVGDPWSALLNAGSATVYTDRVANCGFSLI